MRLFAGMKTIRDYIRYKAIQHNRNFIVAFLVGILTYSYMMTNKIPNWDEVISMFTKGTTISSGRWGLEHTDLLFPNFSLPWLWGIIGICIVSLAACIIIEIFGIKNKRIRWMILGLMVSFPALVSTFSYMFTLPSDSLGLLISISAVFLAIKPQNHIVRNLFPVIFLIISMSIYQAYLPIAVSLFMIYIIQLLLQDKTTIKEALLEGLRLVAIIGVSCIIYYLITKLELKRNNTQFNSIAQSALDFRGIPHNIIVAYEHFVSFFTIREASLITSDLSKYLHLLILFCTLTDLIVLLIKIKNPIKAFILCLLLLLFPLGVNSLFLIITPNNIGTMESYSFYTVYVLIAVILDNNQETITIHVLTKRIAPILMGIIMAINIYTANRCWLQLQFAYKNLEAVYTTITTQIYMTPGFNAKSKVVFVGKIPDNQSLSPFFDESQLEGIPYSLLNIYSIEYYLNRYLDFNVPIIPFSWINGEEVSEIINRMPEYPYYGYIESYGDYIIVNLGNEQ